MVRHAALRLLLYGNTVCRKEETGMLPMEHNFFFQTIRAVCPVYLSFVPNLCVFASEII